MKRLLTLFLCLSFNIPSLINATEGCTLTMAVKDVAKVPLISGLSNNEGVYLKLFQKAANMIQCKLNVVRLPKKHAQELLKTGSIDFYPDVTFTEERASYLQFIPNGLITGQYGVSTDNIPEIKDYKEIPSLHLIWMMEPGSSEESIANTIKNVSIQFVKNISIDSLKIIAYQQFNPFTIIDKSVVDYYMLKNNLSSLSAIGLKVHKNCCGGDTPMYLGFSKHSPHYSEEANPNYDPAKPLSEINSPTRVTAGSVAYQLKEALLTLQKTGETDKMYQKILFSGKK